MSSGSSCTVKYMGKAHSVPAGNVMDVKIALTLPTGLAACAMKIICAGKVLDNADEVKPNAKLMMMRCASQPDLIRLTVREIVTGRLAPRVEVSPSAPHGELISAIVKALLLPPCDESTEVRIFLPMIGVLMRPDLTLADYALPASRALEVFAVPCPRAPQCEHAAQMANELRREATAQAERELTPEEATLALHELAAHAAIGLSPHDAMAMRATLDALTPASMLEECMRPDEGMRPEDSAREAVEMAEAPPLALPPSLVETSDEASAKAGIDVPPTPPTACVYGARATSSNTTPQTGNRSTGAAPSAASFVPTRLRTGLMASHDELPPPLERPLAALLAAEMENYERACEPPSAAEWEAYAAHEEARLEERCAELISSLAPAMRAQSPAHRRSRAAGELQRGFHSRGGRHRRSRSAPLQPRAVERLTPRAAAASRAAMRRSPDLGLLCSSSSSASSSSPGESAYTIGSSAGRSTFSLSNEDCEMLAEECSPCAVDGPHELPKGGVGGKVKGTACRACGCRLPLTACASACKCGEIFCAAHMHEHACVFDYKRGHETKLREENPKLEGPKLERL